jgi:peptidoglycan/xylan/chitin deacetylase (PgdA/CDA1 family)
VTESRPYARHGPLVRLVYLATAIVYWFVTRLRGGPAGTVVLCYHAVRAAQVRQFAWQMRHVARRAAPAAALVDNVPVGETGMPRVCVTFDDGYHCVLEHALPVMRQSGVPATMFAIPGRLGAPPAWPMPPDDPDRDLLVASGRQLALAVHQKLCSIGSHTLTHAGLPGLAAPQLHHELTASKAALESLVGAPVTDLAFPYGAYDAACLRAAFAAGYQRVFTLEPQVWCGSDGCGVIGRFLVSPEMWRLEFALTCTGAYAWLGAWRRLWRHARAWLRVGKTAPQEATAV